MPVPQTVNFLVGRASCLPNEILIDNGAKSALNGIFRELGVAIAALNKSNKIRLCGF